MQKNPGKVACIFGCSGFLGSNIVRPLTRKGWRIIAVTRSPYKNNRLKMYGPVGDVDLEKLSNLFDEEEIRKFLKASSVVINCVGILNESKQNSFEAIHTRFPAMLSRLCAEYDKSLVHISSLGIEASSATSRYAKTKLEGEKIILETLKNKSIILRSGLMLGTDDKFLNTLASLCQISPFLPLIGQGLNYIQPIAVTDTAKAIVEVLEKEEINNNIYELGGPNTFTFKELMEILLKQIKKKRFLISIPFSFAKIQAKILQLFPKPLLTTDQVEMLKYDNVVTNSYPTIKDFKINLSNEEMLIQEQAIEILNRQGFCSQNYIEIAQSLNISPDKLKLLINIAEKDQKIIRINEELLFTSQNFNNLVKDIKKFFDKNEKLTVSDFKNIANTSRKYAVPLLEYLDKQNITYREDNYRKLA